MIHHVLEAAFATIGVIEFLVISVALCAMLDRALGNGKVTYREASIRVIWGVGVSAITVFASRLVGIEYVWLTFAISGIGLAVAVAIIAAVVLALMFVLFYTHKIIFGREP